MRVLIDTNVLLRSVSPGHPLRPVARRAFEVLDAAGHTLVLVPQVLYEFWTVGTRSTAANGLGLPAEVVRGYVDHFRDLFQLRRDERAIFEGWLDLVTEHGVTGVNAYDVRLVAAMHRHGVTHLLTFNAKDFRRFDGVTVTEPGDWSTTPPG